MTETWLQKHWRPILMVIFTGLITAHWFGLTSRDIPESVQNTLLHLIMILGGVNIAGRSVEKVIEKLKK